MKFEKVKEPEEGDIATHVSGALDPRAVSRLSPTGDMVWLALWDGGSEIGPFPVENYIYRRPVKEGSDA